jgi:hypothetical protein
MFTKCHTHSSPATIVPCSGSGMVKEIVKKEDKAEGTSSKMYEDIHLIFDFNNTCLNLDL